MTYNDMLQDGTLILNWIDKQPQDKIDVIYREKLHNYLTSVLDVARTNILKAAYKSRPSYQIQLAAIKELFKKAEDKERWIYQTSDNDLLVCSFIACIFDTKLKDIAVQFNTQDLQDKYKLFLDRALLNEVSSSAWDNTLSAKDIKTLIANCKIQPKNISSIIIGHKPFKPENISIALRLLGGTNITYHITKHQHLFIQSENIGRLIIAPVYVKPNEDNKYTQYKDFTFITKEA